MTYAELISPNKLGFFQSLNAMDRIKPPKGLGELPKWMQNPPGSPNTSNPAPVAPLPGGLMSVVGGSAGIEEAKRLRQQQGYAQTKGAGETGGFMGILRSMGRLG